MLGNLLDASAALNLTLYHTLIHTLFVQSVTQSLREVYYIGLERENRLFIDVSFFISNDFQFPIRRVVPNILGHLDKLI
jgi:hypothetical protein